MSCGRTHSMVSYDKWNPLVQFPAEARRQSPSGTSNQRLQSRAADASSMGRPGIGPSLLRPTTPSKPLVLQIVRAASCALVTNKWFVWVYQPISNIFLS